MYGLSHRIFGALGLNLGEAHVVRNAVVLPAIYAIRSLLLSQWLLGTGRSW